ncbi:MAG: TonB-dependent receptor, partial [Alphaproteobacteria bacterium]|nr:TonB-dependent receptor [Alphaproteobacteria bacterium]
APVTANGSNNDPWRGGSIQVINGTLGNPLLKSEKSINTQLGVVLQPSWFPGFNTSLDYYRIYLSGQITGVPTQTSVNNCYAGLTQFCNAIQVAGGLSPAVSSNWIQVNSQAFNTANTVTDGFNWETTYQFSLADWGFMPIPGTFTVRAMATYVSKFINTPGLPGTFRLNTAGSNDGATPHLKAFLTQAYQSENWEIHLSENLISEGRHNLNWIQCTPGTCPVPTLQNPTVQDNHVPGIFYLNLGGSLNLSEHWTLYGQVDNLLNKNPPPFYSNSQNPTNDGANPLLYDTIGRMFHVGVRISD